MQPPHTILKKYIKQLAGSWVVGAGNISFVPGSGFWPSSTGKYLEDHPSWQLVDNNVLFSSPK